MLKQLNLRFAWVLALYLGVILLADRDEVLGPILAPLTVFTASVAHLFLSLLDMGAILDGNVVTHPGGFAYQIYYSCTAFIPMLSLAVAVLAYPSTRMEKYLGIGLGVPLLFLFNQARLVHLFYVGVFAPEDFEYVHHVLWEYLMILTVSSLWLSWVAWAALRIDSASTTLFPVAFALNPPRVEGALNPNRSARRRARNLLHELRSEV